MIEIILALIAVALLIGLIYYNKREKKIDILRVPESYLRYTTITSPEFEKILNKWKKLVNNPPKKRRNDVSKKRKKRINSSKKTRGRKG